MTSDNPHTATDAPNHGEAAPQAELCETVTIQAGQQNTEPEGTKPALNRGATKAWVGQSLGKYRITACLGQGGMGTVFRAHDSMIERDVAIKVLMGKLAADESAADRFLAEAKAAGKLNHPNVVAIHEICQDGHSYYLVLEFVEGGSLSDWLSRGALSVLDATQAMIDSCKGLGAAHAAGLIHRDVKPANLMRAADGTIKVADFGLAKAADTGRQFTHTGMIVGTPNFMSPEQCESRPLDHRSDIYSLGATYYSLLTGKDPYQNSDSIAQLMYQHCHGLVPDPRAINPNIPEACARIITRAMAKAPADRYQSTNDMMADLQALARRFRQTEIAPAHDNASNPAARVDDPGRPAPSRRRRLRWASAGALALTALVVALLMGRPTQKPPEAAPSAVAVVPPTTAAAVPPVLEPIKIGVLHSLSGTMATSESPVVDAVLFAIDEVNQAGGVLGRPVKPVVADGRSDWPTFAREAERLITQEKVCTVFGCWTSASRKTVKRIFEEHDHLLVYPVQFEGLETSPCIVYLGAAPNQQLFPAVDWAMTSLHKKRFFLVGSDYVFPRSANAIIRDHLKGMDAQVVGEQYAPLGSQDFGAVVNAIVRAHPDMILNTINGDSNIGFYRALRAAGILSANVPTLAFSIDEQGQRSLNPAHMNGDFAAWTYFQSVASPENEEFVRRFHEKYPQRSVTDPMETAYMGVRLWANAVNEAQSLEPKKIRRALHNQRLLGPGGEIRVDADTQYAFRTPRIAQIQADGQFQIVWTAPAPVRPDPYPNSRSAEAWGAFLHDLYTGWGNRWAAPDVDVPKGK
jgi:urea transport system substrate-binding protein